MATKYYKPRPRLKEQKDSLHTAVPPAATGVISSSARMMEAVATAWGAVGKTPTPANAQRCLGVAFTAAAGDVPETWAKACIVWLVPPTQEPGFKIPRTTTSVCVDAGSPKFARLLAALDWRECVGIPRLRKLMPMPEPTMEPTELTERV